MVVIDEEEYIDLDAEVTEINPYTGKPAKFHMDKFFGKYMHPPDLNAEEIEEILKELHDDVSIKFILNENEIGKKIEAVPLVELRPSLFNDEKWMDRMLTISAETEEKLGYMNTDKFLRQKRKQRLVEFNDYIHDYLDHLRPEEKFTRWHNPDYQSPYGKKGRLKPGFNKDGTRK